jgi:hypothetical protein
MVSMDDRVRVGSMIHRNRAALADANKSLAELAKLMPRVDRARRRELRQMARELRWTRVQLWLSALVLLFRDTR